MLMDLRIGIGNPQPAEHFERRMVGRDEGKQIASTGNMVTQDWDAAWESEEEEPLPPGTNRASVEEERKASEVFSPASTPAAGTPATADDEDDAADAWGWGDEDAVDEPISEDVVQPHPGDNTPHRITPETREVTLSESYKTSSMPQPVLRTVAGIFNDGARLTSPAYVLSIPLPSNKSNSSCSLEHSPVTPAAPVLFSLPTLVLAMYRSVSPHYYTQHHSGNM
jgi:centromere/kinetochore protein ZW10